MWCWHRIRNEASDEKGGLCPACRNPYGDDPHEFSALDLADVIKANKDKALAERREKEKRMQEYASGGSGLVMSEHHFPSLANGGAAHSSTHLSQENSGSGSIPTIVVNNSRSSAEPRDRSSLANMRVIRRNLVYAVGLPPAIANEDLLKKAEYFGQYGKVSKIVLNRSNISNANTDSNRRSSASAYVTFSHKEDTLACILALDGFYLENRNIRASYGTSKYCSAFIKNVRCNNPDCTYLHVLGDTEDTFTKQEIQAGYVTSGRDVLAKQQQQLASVTGGGSGRRRVGGGGPSGTGKVSVHPVFPPPTFDEPEKPPTRQKISNVTRASSLPNNGHSSTTLQTSINSSNANATSTNVSESNDAKPPAAARTKTAAYIVASSNGPSHQKPVTSSKPHLTPLKPVQRSVSLPMASLKASDNNAGISKTKSNLTVGPPLASGSLIVGPPNISSSSNQSDTINQHNYGFGSIGVSNGLSLRGALNVTPPGSVEGVGNNSVQKGVGGHKQTASLGSIGSEISGLRLNGFDMTLGKIPNVDESKLSAPGVSSNLHFLNNNERQPGIWGAVGGSAPNSSWGASIAPPTSRTASFSNTVIGSLHQDPLKSNQNNVHLGGRSYPQNGMIGQNNSGFWGNNPSTTPIGSATNVDHSRMPPNQKVVGGDLNEYNQNGGLEGKSGSSALASMLGINLPTGSGSLREITSGTTVPSADPFGSSPHSSFQNQHPQNHGQMHSLWNDPYTQSLQNPPVGAPGMSAGVIGSIRSGTSTGANTIGPNPSIGSDIALLQNLLPGVNITSGNASQPAHPNWGAPSSWNSPPSNGENKNGAGQEGDSNQADPWGSGGLYPNQALPNNRGIW